MYARNSFLILFIGLLSFPLIAQDDIDVPQKQIPLVTKISASWCPFCGAWGWDFMETLLEDNLASSNLITAHYSGDYRSQAGAQMTTNFGAFGQPQFFLNSDLISVNSSTAAEMRAQLKSTIQELSAKSPDVQTGILAGPNNGRLNVVTKTRFFNDLSGMYYLGLYVVENTFTGPQAGRGSNAVHKYLLRSELLEDVFGTPLASGSIEAGTETIVQQSISLSDFPYSLDNVQLLSIIWKKEGSKYLIVNTNSITEFQSGVELITTTANRRLGKADFQLSIQPNVVSDFSLLKLILPSQRKNFRIELWAPDGRKVKDIFQGALPAGEHQWSIDRAVGDPAGMYFLRLYDESGQMSRRVIFGNQ